MFDENHLRELAAGHTFEHKGIRYQTALELKALDSAIKKIVDGELPPGMIDYL